jgi:hypothetical protein
MTQARRRQAALALKNYGSAGKQTICVALRGRARNRTSRFASQPCSHNPSFVRQSGPREVTLRHSSWEADKPKA